MRTIAGFCVCLIATQLCALESAALRTKIKDLQDPNPAVRAAAVRALTPLLTDLYVGVQARQRDPDPEVIKAFHEFQAVLAEKSQKTPELREDIPANETQAAKDCLRYAEAQEVFRRTDYDRDNTLEFTPAVKGDHSLYESKAGERDLNFVSEAFANAVGKPGEATPSRGYLFKVLTRQGADAPHGVLDYMKEGNQIRGYALLAFPAVYGTTGKHCFLINNQGTIYQKDLGADTHALVEKINEFNPDKTWVPAE